MRVFILPLLAIAASGSALAQSSTLDKVYSCSGITKAEDRMACFDAAVAGFKQAQATGEVQVVTREQAVAAEKQAFGLRTSDAAVVARSTDGVAPPAPKAIENVQLKLMSAVKRADGRYRFTMEDGQVWEQVETSMVGGVNRLPAPAEIKSAAFGSFMMKIDDGRAIRVRRVK